MVSTVGAIFSEGGREATLELEGDAGAPGAAGVAGVDEDAVGWGVEEVALVLGDGEAFALVRSCIGFGPH